MPKPAPEPVIIDADAGDDIDDAYALAWALRSPRLKVEAIVTAFGDTALRARQVQGMLRAMGRTDVAVGTGIATPPGTVFTQKAWAERQPAAPAADGVTLALDTIRSHPGAVTLIALAPLTNIEAMIARDPGTFAKLRRVLVMGGSIRRGYDKDGRPNPTPDAEYNAAQSPAGLRALLASGVPVSLFPLDSTQIRLSGEPAVRLAASRSPTAAMLAELTREWAATNVWKQTMPTLFDAVPVAAVIDPALCPVEPLRLSVDDKGFTRLDPAGAKANVCLVSDGAAILNRLTHDLLATH